eukprot:TRINITY_DN1485_c0_g3_i1.p1 TRINITY_DN1485_c0_g3~~TRINITY_DN1485_c0_g3_i1.p1  ORF type:complete len:350 (+),score=108.90 TRINITY_DN1485_c0_g3_i1:84-1133(+)
MSRLGTRDALAASRRAAQRRRIGNLGKLFSTNTAPGASAGPTPAQAREEALESSSILSSMADAAARLERVYGWARRSQAAQVLHPTSPCQANMWVEMPTEVDVTATVLSDVHDFMEAEACVSKTHVLGEANTTERGMVAADADMRDPGWLLWYQLLTGRRYRRTMAEQTMEELFKVQPDFSEGRFLKDVEKELLPSFLEAFWARDHDRLRGICTSSCYHLDVCTQLHAYHSMQSRCEFVCAIDAHVRSRMMVEDDSEFASPDGLRENAPPPQPVLFIEVRAQVVDCWTIRDSPTAKRASAASRDYVAQGTPDEPEDWMYWLGVIPLHSGRWQLATFGCMKFEHFTQLPR